MAVITTVPVADPPAGARAHQVGRLRAMALPLAFVLTIAALCLLPSVRPQVNLVRSLLGACGALAIWIAALAVRSARRQFEIDVRLRPQHYLQAAAQAVVLLYWGWYWRPVYEAVPLLAAQLAFAYAFDILLAWSRRDDYTLGFGPFPVVFSTNLFLWFKPDWFYLQFVLLGLGFAAKELIRWNKGGRRTHIFNPSSFPLAVFSLVLIATDSTSMTWGVEIARTQFNAPHIYLLLFLVGLPGQFLFGVTSMTMSAVVTTYLFGLAYFGITGTYFFIDSYIPVAVFLGMHLLFTDPSTAPRTESGRIVFGMMYGLSTVALYAMLGRLGIPTFYDKLLPVPLMNVTIQMVDRVAPGLFGWADPAALKPAITGRRRNLIYVAVWALTFATMSAAGGVGDNHPGRRVPFWQEACGQNRTGACETLGTIAGIYCADGSGWACDVRGVLRAQGKIAGASDEARADFSRACGLGFKPSCRNAVLARLSGVVPAFGYPTLRDYPIILRSGKGPVPDKTPLELLTRACDQGFMSGCENVAALYLHGDGVARDPGRAAAGFQHACDGGLPSACSNVGYMFYTADGVPEDKPRGLASLKRACDLGMSQACRWLEETTK